MSNVPYVGRFAPSPTGPLHLGSMACALASWLDARAHDGQWLIRIEDIDPPRDVPGADRRILDVLAAFELTSDAPVVWQHDRDALYRDAWQQLRSRGLVYGCACTRSQIAQRNRALGLPAGVYPGTCRGGVPEQAVRAWRFRTKDRTVHFTDRRMGKQAQNVEREVGDFVVLRADGLWAYQLAVVVDDHAQGVTHVVRGADLLDNTARQIALAQALGYVNVRYMHIALVCDAQGNKLSKQTHAAAVGTDACLTVLELLWQHLGFDKRIGADSVAAFLRCATDLWRERWGEHLTLARQSVGEKCDPQACES